MEDQRICFHTNIDSIPDYKILSFEKLLYSQWQQQRFVGFRKLSVYLSINFYFWKIEWLTGGIECVTEIIETVLREMYVHRAKFCIFLFLSVGLSR